jgi:hypothetical protein
MKPIYHFNKPIVFGSVVRFVKYKNELRYWEIVITPTTIAKPGAELPAISITIMDGFGRRVAGLIVSEYELDGNKHYMLKLDDYEIGASLIYEFEYYIVIPNVDVPYAVPIWLADFVNRLMYYKYIALKQHSG